MSTAKDITFDVALELAKEYMSRFNRCSEQKNAYTFWYDWGEPRDGGAGSPCVILKKDGKAVSMPTYIIRYGGGDSIRDIPVETYINENQ